MRGFVECVHAVNFRERCGDCEATLEYAHEIPTDRIVSPGPVVDLLDALERNQAPSSLSEALNSGDGTYRP
jgi:hypothetical protein